MSSCTRKWRLAVVMGLLASGCGSGEEAAVPSAPTTAPVNPTSEQGCPEDGSVGLKADRILVGSSNPQSGIFSVYRGIDLGIRAYFDTVNAAGGIDGKRLELVSYDDEMRASNTKRNVQRLIEDDQVFALLGVFGTDNNLAVRELVNRACIPNLSLGSGAAAFDDPNEFQWEVPGFLAHQQEMATLADALAEGQGVVADLPEDPRVGVVADRGGDGPSYAAAFEAAMSEAGVAHLEPAVFDSVASLDASAQVKQLVDDGANVVVIATAGKACPSTVALRPEGAQLVVTQECAPGAILAQAGDSAAGVWSVRSSLDPNSATTPNGLAGESLASFETATEGQATAADAGILELGWDQAALFVSALRNSEELRRSAVVDAMRKIPEGGPAEVGLHSGPFEIAGGSASPWVVNSSALQRWSGEAWEDL